MRTRKQLLDQIAECVEQLQKLESGEELPEWLPKDVWEAFLEMRKKIKHPATEYAIKLLIQELDKLQKQGGDPRAILEQSIRNGWRDVWPVKHETTRPLFGQEPEPQADKEHSGGTA